MNDRAPIMKTACGIRLPSGSRVAAMAIVLGHAAAWAEVPTGHCGDDGSVCWEHPLPQGNALVAAWGASERDVWLVGSAGTIVRFDGTHTTRVASGTTEALRAVWGSGPADVWTAGDGGALLHFDGRGWTSVAGVRRAGLRALWGSGPADVWAAGERGALLHFDGARFADVPSGARETLLGLGGTGPADVYAVGAGGALLHFDGAGWSRQRSGPNAASGTPGALYGVWAKAPGDVWFFTATGPLLHVERGAWSAVPRGTPSQRLDLLGAWRLPAASTVPAGAGPALPANANANANANADAIAIDRCGVVLRAGALTAIRGAGASSVAVADLSLLPAPSVDYDAAVGVASAAVGITPRPLCPADGAAPPVLHAISLRGEAGFAVGTGGAILRRADAGWAAVASPVTATLHGVTIAGPVEAWATGGGAVLRWDGRAFALVELGVKAPIEAVWANEAVANGAAAASAELWFAGGAGTVVRRDAAGHVATVPSGTTLPLASIWGTGFGTGLGLGTGTGAVAATAGGAGARAGRVFVAGGEARVGSREPAGVVLAWDGRRLQRVATAGAPLFAIAGSGPSNVWAAGARGTLLHFDGKRWSPAASGVTEDLTALWAPSPTEAWAAGKSGTMLRLRDGRWQRVESGTKNHLYAIAGSGATVRVAGMNGTILALRR